MAKSKAKPRKKAARRKPQQRPVDRLRETWKATLGALASAQRAMEKQARALVKRNQISSREASRMLRELRSRAERERSKALTALEGGVQSLQARLKKDRKAAGLMVQDAVQSGLAALNIPSRQEIADLTRKVEALSRKLDARKR
jgi:polyhydroxyalkanoate synthesis regulator phasin